MSELFTQNLFTQNNGGGAGGEGGAVNSVNGKTGNVVITKSDVGLTLVNNTSDLDKPVSTATNTAIDSKIAAHNLSDQAHNDIRNMVVGKANLPTSDNTKIGTIAVIGENGQYDVSTTKLQDVVDDIDIFNQNLAVLTTDTNTIKDNYVSKNTDNTLNGKNTFKGDIVLESKVRDAVNGKVILTTKAIDANTEATYVGGDQVEIYAPDSLSIEAESITVKRNDADGVKQTYTNIDSGNIYSYISGGGSSNDKYGIEADYKIKHGIVECPEEIITFGTTSKEITIKRGLVLKLPNTNILTTFGNDMTYTVQGTGDITLFYVRTQSDGGTNQADILESPAVYWQDELPQNVANHTACYTPSTKQWHFYMEDNNVWNNTAIATPFADINASATIITSIKYYGYRVFNDACYAEISDIDSIQGLISDINTNVSTIDTEVDGLQTAVTDINNTLNTNKFVTTDTFQTITGSKQFNGITTFNGVTKLGLIQDSWNREVARFLNGELQFGNQSYDVLKLTSKDRATLNGSEIQTAADKGVANGVASLDANAKIPASQIPVDGTTITVNAEGNLVASGGSSQDSTVSGDKVQVSYLKEGATTATEQTLNQYCAAVDHDITNLADLVPANLSELIPSGCAGLISTDTVQSITGDKTFTKTIVANGGVRMAAGQALSAGSDTLVQMVENYPANGTNTDSVIVGAQGSTDRLVLQASAGVLHKRGSLFFDVVDSGNVQEYAQPKIATYAKADLPAASENAGTIAYVSDLDCLAYCTGTAWKQIALAALPDVV